MNAIWEALRGIAALVMLFLAALAVTSLLVMVVILLGMVME